MNRFQIILLFLLFVSGRSYGFEYLNGDKFDKFLQEETSLVKQLEKNEKKKEIKVAMIERVREALTTDRTSDDEFKFSVDEELYDVEIWEKFSGEAEKGVELYRRLTLGKETPGLFVLSKAGASETISSVKPILGGYEFITDRVYTSPQAYNTKNKIRLLFFRLSNGRTVVVNQHREDFGRGLAKKGIKKEGKTYGPIHYDLTIDLYRHLNETEFQFIQFNIYDGQATKSRHKSVETLQTVGDWVTLGTLGKGVSLLVKQQAEKIWLERKTHFQLHLSNRHH